MQFEDQRSGQLHSQAVEERDGVEQAFWDACRVEVGGAPPTYEHTLQLLHEVRDIYIYTYIHIYIHTYIYIYIYIYIYTHIHDATAPLPDSAK